MLRGYARVSTKEQETHLQIDALQRAGCTQIYQEKRSGGNLKRPELLRLLNELQPGDTIIVYKLDRFARSLRDLLDLVEIVENKEARFHSLTEHIDTTTPVGRMIFQIIGAFAEFERALIKERVTAGIQAAMKRGSRFGAKPKMTPEQEAKAMELWQSGNYTKSALARANGVHISSIKRAITRNGLSQRH
jgi:DNA invertase Pin-like site-specific DNA recombinase